MLDNALQYAGRGWRVFPCHTPTAGGCSCGKPECKDIGKHPRIKAWQKAATTDPEQISRWWDKWPDANIAIATGGALVVIDLDGAQEAQILKEVVEDYGPLPPAPTVRTGRGAHLYFAGSIGGSRKVDGLLIRGDGGYVIAPPSLHASGRRYEWIKQAALPDLPLWFSGWMQDADPKGLTTKNNSTLLGLKPVYLINKNNRLQTSVEVNVAHRAAAALKTPWNAVEETRIVSALQSISADTERDTWLHIGMALHGLDWERADGTNIGFDLWNRWSATAKAKYQGEHDLETRWRSFGKAGREHVTLGTLFHYASQSGWQPPLPRALNVESEVMPHPADRSFETTPHSVFTPSPGVAINGHKINGNLLPASFTEPIDEHPLIELNNKYACIGDVGAKCLIMGWVPSKADPSVEIPSFQTFKSFAERFGNRYIAVSKGTKDGGREEESKQLGPYWLKWPKRRSYEGIDLIPDAPEILPNGSLNLWRGFAVKDVPGRWPLLKNHIAEVLAAGDPAALAYILKWSAWAVQNPGERAESALVFRGGKGSGKGTFAHALRRIFGAHGLHVANSKHLVGAFNAHLRNCLFLYADEAFWAGDKQGESTLKALITEATLTIEQKGVDAMQWHNRLHLVMTANAEWVVPASHDERRYAVFNVSEKYMGDEKYFAALHDEINNGGLEAMLHDLKNVKLGKWHPRKIVHTKALTEQKMQSMNPLQEWWESLLQEGVVPAAQKVAPDITMAVYLLNHAREFAPKLRDLNPTRFGRFLSDHGCIKLHRATGNAWRVPELNAARQDWEKRYQGWSWNVAIEKWEARS